MDKTETVFLDIKKLFLWFLKMPHERTNQQPHLYQTALCGASDIYLCQRAVKRLRDVINNQTNMLSWWLEQGGVHRTPIELHL